MWLHIVQMNQGSANSAALLWASVSIAVVHGQPLISDMFKGSWVPLQSEVTSDYLSTGPAPLGMLLESEGRLSWQWYDVFSSVLPWRTRHPVPSSLAGSSLLLFVFLSLGIGSPGHKAIPVLSMPSKPCVAEPHPSAVGGNSLYFMRHIRVEYLS